MSFFLKIVILYKLLTFSLLNIPFSISIIVFSFSIMKTLQSKLFENLSSESNNKTALKRDWENGISICGNIQTTTAERSLPYYIVNVQEMLKSYIHCRIECADLREHTKSEWYVYNLRREAVGLCPISEQDFRTKQNDLVKKSVVKVTLDRLCCGKVYKSVSTLDNHLKSKKHCEKSRDKREK
jgi:Zinc-finger double-stranded RNA-binding